jgi:hypothetical protein
MSKYSSLDPYLLKYMEYSQAPSILGGLGIDVIKYFDLGQASCKLEIKHAQERFSCEVSHGIQCLISRVFKEGKTPFGEPP